MKQKVIIKFLITTGVVTFFLLIKNTAYAAPASLSVYPPIIEIETISPALLQTPVIIQNNTDNKIDLTIGVKPFKASDNFNGQVNYFPSDYQPQPDKNIFNHIALLYQNSGVSKLTLAPKEKKLMSLNVNLPPNEAASDYYFSLVFLSNPPQNTQNTGTVIQTGIATNVLLSVGKRIAPQAEISSFSSPLFVPKGPVDFTVLIKNDNNQILKPQGHILITNMFGQTIGDVNIPQSYILANSQRFLSNGFSYNNQSVSKWNQSFLLGPYSAKLQLSLSDKGPILEKTTYFFAFPAPATAFLLFALVIATLIAKRVRKKVDEK